MNRTSLLLLNVFVIATCGLVYELLAGTLASYLLGDSVTQFSLVIGLYLFAMGVGSWLSRYVETNLARKFIEVELGVALLGGFSAPLLFFSFGRLGHFQWVLFLVVLLIGILVGLEIPLLMQLLKDNLDFKDLVSRVLTFDYIGALAASLLFPLFFVPRLGLVRTSLLFGLLNAAVGLWGTWQLRGLIQGSVAGLRWRAGLALILLLSGILAADRLTRLAEVDLYNDRIVYARSSAYQRIVVTHSRSGYQLFLNGNLQFNSVDEYRYHEALVHPAMGATSAPRRVLVLGGGDGLAVREILKHPSVAAVTLIDIDPAMTNLGRSFAPFVDLNQHSLMDARVQVLNQDAMTWLQQFDAKTQPTFDAAIIDFPDPNNFALGKLYSTHFFRLLKNCISINAAISIQCSSALQARQTYWCIIRTMEAVGFFVQPYHAAIPSFGVWGFALAKLAAFTPPTQVPAQLRFLDEPTMKSMFVLASDLASVEVEVNQLDNQVLVQYYEAEMKRLQ
jgi:spermidine synthase